MGFLFSSKKEKLVAIFDIGSGSVGGALVRISNDKNIPPSIIKSVRTDIVSKKEINFDIFLNDMILALGFTSRGLYQSKLGAPSEVHCVLASPWYISETRIIKMAKDHSFIFSKKIVDNLLIKEIEKLNLKYKDKYGETEGTPEIIEHPIVGVSLNGYQVDDPLGKRTRSIEMNMIISLSPKICLDKISNNLLQTFNDIPITFSSFMTTSYLSIRDKYSNLDSYLLLDVGGEVTDIGIVYKGILRESLSFPFGRKTLFNAISKELNIELRDSNEKFNLFTKNLLSKKEKDKFEPVLDLIGESWAKSFVDCLSSLPRAVSLPNILFITIDSDIKDYFIKIIRNDKKIISVVPSSILNVVSIDGPDFLNSCNIKDGPCDPFLMIETINIIKKFNI